MPETESTSGEGIRTMDIGLILGAFGIKGEVRILSLNDEPERFSELKDVVVVNEGGIETGLEIVKVRLHKKYALVLFKGIDNRTKAENLKGSYVRLLEPDGELSRAEEAKVERDRLIGLKVFTKSGEFLGELEEVIRTGANDVYEVSDGKRTVLLPAINDVIKSIDLENGRMVVDPLPGLL